MMKVKNIILAVLVAGFGLTLTAQEVVVENEAYVVKKEAIFKKGKDVTASLSTDEKAKIMKALDEKQLRIAKEEKVKKQIEKAEKEEKKAKKKQKKAEKALKQKQKAQSNFDKASKRHEDAIKKYEKLKKKGKLSPQDEKKWLEKIEKLNSNLEKTKKKLKRA